VQRGEPLNGGHNLQFDSARTPGPVATAVSILQAKQGSEQLLIEELGRLVRCSRQEAGCLLFDLYRIAGPSSTFALHEVWEIREAMEAHSCNFHTTKFRMTAEKYLAHPIKVLELEEMM
jgi:quinol monooxygenase YgiN